VLWLPVDYVILSSRPQIMPWMWFQPRTETRICSILSGTAIY